MMQTLRLSAGLLVLLFGASSAGAIELFTSGKLFIAENVKESSETRFISVGMNFQFAPIEALGKQVIGQIEDQNPEARLVFDTLREIPEDELDAMTTAASQGGAALEAFIVDQVPGLTPEQQTELSGAIGQIDDDQLKTAAELAKIAADPEPASTFIFEPYVNLNFKFVEVELGVPLAGFYTDEAEFLFGNLYYDVKTGWTWGKAIGVGVSVGFEGTLPTGRSSRLNSLALANVFAAPHFLADTMSFAPYAVAGVDVLLFNFQAYGKYVTLVGTGDAEVGNAMYMQYGLVAAFAPFRALNLIAELNGTSEVANASPFNTLFVTAGVKTLLFVVRPGIAVHLPLMQESDSDFGGGSFGSPSAWSIIASLSVDI
jgi:hypothetical protein